MKDDKKVKIPLGMLEFLKSRNAQLERENDLLTTELAETTEDAARLYREIFRLTANLERLNRTLDVINKLMKGKTPEEIEIGGAK